jgi:NADPH:quinone reductase-like Zn-dependent oxidoreductase
MTSQRTSGLPPVAAEGAIVVFGATGGVGRYAVEQLLGAG